VTSEGRSRFAETAPGVAGVGTAVDSAVIAQLMTSGFAVPPAGFEPAPPPPEGGALSPELRGLKCAEGISGPCAVLSDA
jgi:hypothetical protein